MQENDVKHIMKEKYILYGFCYINGPKGLNIITDNKEEANEEKNVLLFDGIGFYLSDSGKYYILNFPKFQDLTEQQKEQIKKYCGFYPEKDDFGQIFGAIGTVKKVSRKKYLETFYNAWLFNNLL